MQALGRDARTLLLEAENEHLHMKIAELKDTVTEQSKTIKWQYDTIDDLHDNLHTMTEQNETVTVQTCATIPTSTSMMYTKSGTQSREYRRRRTREKELLLEAENLHGGRAALVQRHLVWIKELGPLFMMQLLQEPWVSRLIVKMHDQDSRLHQSSLSAKTHALVARARLHGLGRDQWNTIHQAVEGTTRTFDTRLGKLRTTRVLISQYGMDEARYKMSQQPWMPAAPLDGAAIAQTYELPVFNQVKCAMRSFKNYMSSIIKLILEVPCLRREVKVCSRRRFFALRRRAPSPVSQCETYITIIETTTPFRRFESAMPFHIGIREGVFRRTRRNLFHPQSVCGSRDMGRAVLSSPSS